MALRQTMEFVESLLRLINLDWSVPDFSTLCRRQKTLSVNISYRSFSGPLQLLIDRTGIKVEDEGECNARKHGSATAGTAALQAPRRLGRMIWRRWSGYHRRSRAETKMHRVQMLGQWLMARDFTSGSPSSTVPLPSAYPSPNHRFTLSGEGGTLNKP